MINNKGTQNNKIFGQIHNPSDILNAVKDL